MDEPNYTEVNLNDEVHVRLTDYGRNKHRENHEKFWASTNHPKPPIYKAPNETDGWSKWQLWHLIEQFGPHISMGRQNCFDLKIRVAK